jgi:MFS family permease
MMRVVTDVDPAPSPGRSVARTLRRQDKEAIVAGKGPLGSRSFRWVWGGEAVSMLGDASYGVAFAWLVLSESRSPATLGAVLLVRAVPRGLLLLVGGAITDHFSPRVIMLAAHLLRAAVVTGLTVLVATDALHLWHFYVTGVVFGVAEAFFWPASASIVPSLVEPEQLPRANALVGVAEQASMLTGPVLGGALTVLAGTTAALGFNAITFIVAAGTVLRAPRYRGAGDGERFSISATWRAMRSGLSYAGRHAEVRVVLLLIAAATLSYSGLFAVGLPALARRFDHGSFVLGAMVSAWGLGQLIGALAASVTGLPRRWGLLIVGMTVVEGASFATLGLVPHYLLAVVLLALLGIGVAYSTDVALPTFVQTRTPPELLGRVNSVLDLPRVTLEPASIAVMGVLASIDVRWAFGFAALPMLLVGVGLAASPTARRLSTLQPA